MGKRRANGEGSIGKHKDGRYVGRYWVTLPNGSKKRLSVYGKTREEASTKMEEAMFNARRGMISAKDGGTIQSFHDYWVTELAPTYLAGTTIEVYERQFKSRILPIIGKKKLSSLTPANIQTLINTVEKQTKSPKQCHDCKVALSSMLKMAKLQGKIIYNPAHGTTVPKYEPREKELWTNEELGTFLKYAETNMSLYPVFVLLATYGLRASESLGLRREDVELFDNPDEDGKYGTIKIRQQIVTLDGTSRPSALKTTSSKRDLPVTKEVKTVLEKYITDNSIESGLLFKTASGRPITRTDLRQRFVRGSAKAGLKSITLHAFRHMAATRMRDAGVDVKTCQVILGHADPTTTLRVYQHSNMSDKTNALIKMSKLYNQSELGKMC